MLDLAAEFPLVESRVRAAVDQVLAAQHFIGGPQIAELETRLAALCGCRAAIAVSSGTDALLVALMALNIGRGDEVITTPFTFFATAGAIHRVGARPVFVDIEPDTFNIAPASIAAAVTPRTRAILPVHLFGQCADMDAILEIAERHGLAVIEDAAQAIGATHRGRSAGAIGTLGCLSFYPTKNLGGFGEGGMVLTHDEALAVRCRQTRNHGETSRYHHQFVGGNFRLDTMKAAILLVKCDLLASFNEKRIANARAYDELLAGLDAVQTPVVRPYNQCTYHQYSILCERRDELKACLMQEGINTGVYYPVPLHLQECFADLAYRRGDLPVSEQTAERILSLPVHPMLTGEDRQRVAAAVRRFYTGDVPCPRSADARVRTR
jgi:dTDP-4-amino-4,6-dideoxygalactose transaminase